MVNNMNDLEEIDYRYLNIDTKKFHPSQAELVESIGECGFIRAISNLHGQVLYAASNEYFSECAAILTCRRLTGILNNNKV